MSVCERLRADCAPRLGGAARAPVHPRAGRGDAAAREVPLLRRAEPDVPARVRAGDGDRRLEGPRRRDDGARSRPTSSTSSRASCRRTGSCCAACVELGAADTGGAEAMAPANVAYTGFLVATATQGSVLEIMAAILPVHVELRRHRFGARRGGARPRSPGVRGVDPLLRRAVLRRDRGEGARRLRGAGRGRRRRRSSPACRRCSR